MKNSRACTILLAEDDLDDQLLFREAVAAIGYPVQLIEVQNGPATLDLLNSTDTLPDFVVLDVNMPLINGIDCLKAMRKDPRLAHIPVAIMSTSGNEATIASARKAGATKYAIKPARFDDLIAIVRYMCLHPLAQTAGDDFILNNAIQQNRLA